METPEKYDLNEYRLEDFSEERARNGEPVCTRNGYAVKILEPNEQTQYEKVFTIFGIRVVDNYINRWRPNGKFLGPEFDNYSKAQVMDLFHPVKIVDTSKGLEINSGGGTIIEATFSSEDDINEFEKGREFVDYVDQNGKLHKLAKPGVEPLLPTMIEHRPKLQAIWPPDHKGFYIGNSKPEENKLQKFQIWIGYCPLLKDQKQVVLTGTQEAPTFKEACRILFTERFKGTANEETVQHLISRDELHLLAGNVFPTREEAEKDLSEKGKISMEEIRANSKRSLLSITLEEAIGILKITDSFYSDAEYELQTEKDKGVSWLWRNGSNMQIEIRTNSPDVILCHSKGLFITQKQLYKIFKYLESRGFDLDAAFGLS